MWSHDGLRKESHSFLTARCKKLDVFGKSLMCAVVYSKQPNLVKAAKWCNMFLLAPESPTSPRLPPPLVSSSIDKLCHRNIENIDHVDARTSDIQRKLAICLMYSSLGSQVLYTSPAVSIPPFHICTRRCSTVPSKLTHGVCGAQFHLIWVII